MRLVLFGTGMAANKLMKYRQENATLAWQELLAFLNSYGTKYKRLHKLF